VSQLSASAFEEPGGAQSFVAATDPALDLDAVIGFYGTLDPDRIGFPFEMPAPLRHVSETRRPVLGLFGGADELIPAEDIAAFDAGLSEAGIEHEVVAYPGAPHSFFDRSFTEHADASADAWRRVLASSTTSAHARLRERVSLPLTPPRWGGRAGEARVVR
jgi:carboxymethylenebutenolidase